MVAALMQIDRLSRLIARARAKTWNKKKHSKAKLKQMWPNNTILNIDVFIMSETAQERHVSRINQNKTVAFSIKNSLSLRHYDVTFSELGALENRFCAQVSRHLCTSFRFDIQCWKTSRMSFDKLVFLLLSQVEDLMGKRRCFSLFLSLKLETVFSLSLTWYHLLDIIKSNKK